MALLSGGGGDDRLQVELAVFGIVISLMVSALIPVVLAGGSSPTGYAIEDIFAERQSVQLYTGETMINQAPWKLTHVYTPYVMGGEYNLTEEGWLYGTELTRTVDEEEEPYYEVNGENQIGKTSGVRLDPEHKSDTPLFETQEITIQLESRFEDSGIWRPITEAIFNAIFDFLEPLNVLDRDDWVWKEVPKIYPSWSFTGYRYEFDPMLRINTTDGVDKKAVDDAKISVVWYNLSGQEGISAGLVLYNSKTDGIVANYTAQEIVAAYNPYGENASKFRLDFDGVPVNLFIKFDSDVSINNIDRLQAFTDGRWSMALTAASADAFMDLANSTSFTASLGSMLQTYIDIFTLSVPNLDAGWNLVLWIVCVLPMGLAMIMFLSRFGLAGIGAGILGAIFAGGVLA